MISLGVNKTRTTSKNNIYFEKKTKTNGQKWRRNEQLQINEQSHKRVKLRQKKYIYIEEFFVYFPNETKKEKNTYANRWISSFPNLILLIFFSFDFNSCIDFSNKDIWCDKANGACKSPKCKTDQECITEVQHWWDKFSDIKLKQKIFFRKIWFCFDYFGEEIKYWISEDIECRTPWCNKWSPPPMIIFPT